MIRPSLLKKLSFYGILILINLILLEILLSLSGFIYLKLRHNVENIIVKENEFRILCLGESTTALGMNHSYPALLNQRLNEISKQTFKVINRGIPGITSNNILQQLEANLDKYKPHLVILMAGINDHHLPGLQEASFYEELKVYKLFLWINESLFPKPPQKVPVRISLGEPSQYFLGNELQIKNRIANSKENILNILDETLKNKEFNGSDLHRIIDLVYLTKNPNNSDFQKIVKKIKKIHLKIIELLPENPVAYESLTSFLTNQYLEALPNAQWSQETIRYSQKSIEINPNRATSHFHLALALRNKRFFKEAQLEYKKAIELEPFDYNFWYSYLLFLVDTEEYELALQESKRSVQLNPFNSNLKSILSEIETLLDKNGNHTVMFPTTQSIDNPNPYVIPKTLENIKTISLEIIKKNLLLALMQYPLRDINQIKDGLSLGEAPQIAYIENKNNFVETLKTNSFESLFWDSFAGDFGHATQKGQWLIVDNIIKELHSKWCSDIKQLCLLND